MVSKPQIGIWWIIDEMALACLESASTVEPVDGWRDISTSHFDYWHGVLQNQRPELQSDEYTDHPRGRVLFNEKANAFVVYGAQQFLKDVSQQRIVKNKFNLIGQKVKICHDRHYDQTIPLLETFDEEF